MSLIGTQLSSALRTTDAILSDDVETAIHQHVSNHQSFDALGESLIASYVGFPDMVRVLFSWCEDASLDATSILRESTKTVIKRHQHHLIDNLEPVLFFSTGPNILRPLIMDPYWCRVSLALAADHPLSFFCHQLSREHRLAQANLPVSIYDSPATFAAALRNVMQTTMSDPYLSSLDDVTQVVDRLALMSVYEDYSALLALRILGTVAATAKSSITRITACNAMRRIRTCMMQTITSTSHVTEVNARVFAVHTNLVIDSLNAAAKVDASLLNALVALVLPSSRIPTAKRRRDKAIALLSSTYGGLLDDGGGDDDDDEVIETSLEIDLSPNVKFVLIRALCYPVLRDDIAKGLFTSEHFVGTTASPRDRKCECYSILLAYSFICMRETDESLRDKLASSQHKLALHKSVEKVGHRLCVAASLCHRLCSGAPLMKGSKRNLDLLISYVEHPAVAFGSMLWASEGLLGPSDNERGAVVDRSIMAHVRKYMSTLEAIAEFHEVFCHRVMKIVHLAFCRDFQRSVDQSLVEDFRNFLIKKLATWGSLSFGNSVLLYFRTVWLADPHVSGLYVRAFVLSIMQAIDPPYSKDFMTSLLTLLQHDRVVTAVGEDCKLASTVLDFRKRAYDLNASSAGDVETV